MAYLAIFLGGGIGSVSRFLISTLMSHRISNSFPWSTLAVNLIGACLIGVAVELFSLRFSASENFRYFAITGFLGGFTTFSAFSLESAFMWTRGDYLLLTSYISASVIGTILMVLTAMNLTKIFLT